MRVYSALLIALLLGCSGIGYGEAYLRSFNAAKRAYNAGRYEEAARLYGDAARSAKRLKDRDEAYFLEARMYEKLERYEDASATYRKLAEVSPRGPRTARAVYEQALLSIEHGDRAKGYAALEAAIVRYPNHGSARRALSIWVTHTVEAQGEPALQAALDKHLLKLGRSGLSQQLKVELGHSYHRAGDVQRAHAQLVKAARDHPYPRGTLTDDALWHAAVIAIEAGDHTLAIADLRELLSTREVAQGGSYERPRYPQAQMKIAEIYRQLGDAAQARREFHKMYTTHTTSILADDAMWAEAVIAFAQGDRDDACDLADDLPERYPDTRYARCLQEICPTAPSADRPCPDYIKRALHE